MTIVYFIESLRSGGKERRLLELIRYLNQHTDYKVVLVLAEDNIHYKYVNELNVDLKIIKRRGIKKDPRLFYLFYHLCNEFKPDIIHTWGSMLAFYALPTVILKRVKHINSHIADAPPKIYPYRFQTVIEKIGFRFSDVILSNSLAGLNSYGIKTNHGKVIYNGIRPERFKNLSSPEIILKQIGIETRYAVIMVASFTKCKNYDLYLDIARLLLNERTDVTFIGVGDQHSEPLEYSRIENKAQLLPNVMLFDKIENVESLINACDIGVLFSFAEGISNAIIEYMACGKPVIASDAGGTSELVSKDETGFLIKEETLKEIAQIVIDLLNDDNRRRELGEKGKERIMKYFTIDRMGEEFVKLYSEML